MDTARLRFPYGETIGRGFRLRFATDGENARTRRAKTERCAVLVGGSATSAWVAEMPPRKTEVSRDAAHFSAAVDSAGDRGRRADYSRVPANCRLGSFVTLSVIAP